MESVSFIRYKTRKLLILNIRSRFGVPPSAIQWLSSLVFLCGSFSCSILLGTSWKCKLDSNIGLVPTSVSCSLTAVTYRCSFHRRPRVPQFFIRMELLSPSSSRLCLVGTARPPSIPGPCSSCYYWRSKCRVLLCHYLLPILLGGTFPYGTLICWYALFYIASYVM